MTVRAYLWIAVIVLMIAAAFSFKYLVDKNGKLTANNAVLEASHAEVKEQATRFAGRPRTDDDVIDRLCKWAERVEQREGNAKPIVPTTSCP